MARVSSHYFDSRTLEESQQIALANGCAPSIVGVHAAYTTAAARLTWTTHELRDLIVRINDAVLSCFAVEHRPVRMTMTLDTHGHVSLDEILSASASGETACVTRLLVSIDVDGLEVRNPRTFTATFGDVDPGLPVDDAEETTTPAAE